MLAAPAAARAMGGTRAARPFGCVSPRRQAVTCTWETSGRPCTTGRSRAGPAGRSCCGSRTPTGRGLPANTSMRQSARCAGSGSAGTKDRARAARSSGRPAGYDGHCRELTTAQVSAYRAEGRPPVVRFRMPDGSTTFTDLIRGEVTFDHEFVPDFVLARADGSPLYTLAVAVDDVLMKLTHILRGEDMLSSTPRQLAVYRAMGVQGGELPRFAHLPYVLGPDGQKLSKRNGVVSIAWYRHEGFLPEAMCNYLALLGWSPGDDREEFSLAEMAAEFDLRRVNRNPAQFDMKKLEAINGDKIRGLDGWRPCE